MIKFTLTRPNRIIWQEKPSESDIKEIKDINSKYFPTIGKLWDLEDELGRTEDEEKRENIKKRIQELKEEYEKLSKERQKLIDEAIAKIEKLTDNDTLLEIIRSDIPEELIMAALLNPNLSDRSLDEALDNSYTQHLLLPKAPLVFLKKIFEKGIATNSFFPYITMNPNADSDILYTIAERISLKEGPWSTTAQEELKERLNSLLEHPNADEKVYKTLFERGEELPRAIRSKILKKYPKFEQNEGGGN